MKRCDIVNAARTLIGTPYHHAGRLPGINGGLDCIGVVTATAHLIKYPVKDAEAGYSRSPDGDRILRMLRDQADEINVGEQRPGDIGVFWLDRSTKAIQHVAVFSDLPGRLGLIHSYQHVGKVVESGIERLWLRRLVNVFSFRGVED